MSKLELVHTLSESKNTLAVEQKAIVVSFVENVAFLFGHPVDAFAKFSNFMSRGWDI